MPEPYRLWRMCRNSNYWPGGMANQPHLLMMEFTVCSNAHSQFQAELVNMEKILRDN